MSQSAKFGAHAVLDGELVCLDPEGMPIFNATAMSVLRRSPARNRI